MMSVLVQHKHENILYTKGAPDRLIEKSKFILNSFGEKIALSENIKKWILKESNSLGNDGFRVVAIAYKESKCLGSLRSVKSLEEAKVELKSQNEISNPY